MEKSVPCNTTVRAPKYRDLVQIKIKIVGKGMCNELRQLLQGFEDHAGNSTILFIYRYQILVRKK